MGGDSLGKVGEREVNLVAVVIPVAVTAGVEMARWRGAGKSSLFHAPLNRSSLGSDFFRRDRWKNGEAHGLVGAKGGAKWVLPDTVPACDYYREDRTPEALREIEGSRLKCDFDPEDRTLREQENAFSGLDRSAGVVKEGACCRDRALGPDQKVPPALEMAAENRERGKLVSGDNCEREW